MLPPGLPVLPAVRIAGSYLPADSETGAGGDWFDAVPLSGGRVALVVGDVVGHGVAASAAMGQLRALLHDRLDETGDVLAAIGAAERMARRERRAHAATVCVVVLDPADGTLSVCSAGHPPPLAVNGDAGRYLPAGRSGPLGTGAGYTVTTDRLGPGEVVLLYSDGIVERPGRAPAAATVELAQVATHSVAGRAFEHPDLSTVERLCTQTLELLVRETGHSDDITLLAAQRVSPPAPLRLSLAADLGALRPAREAVAKWLHEHDAGHADVEALAHAIVELVTNAAEHSHPDTLDGTVTITAELGTDGVARLGVADDGRWRERARPGSEEFRRDHGLGLAMTRTLVDELVIDRGEHGTTATVHRRLAHPARLITTDEIHHGEPRRPEPAPEVLVLLDQPHAAGNRVAVHGPLDATSCGRLAGELHRLTLGGTHELTVDLTSVSHLASAAVAVLHRAAADGRSPGDASAGGAVRLYAPAGSVAHHVLTLVDLPHTTTDPGAGP
ncbi:SpoIIE family protein phosphatase [Amycolatopsis sp. NPDC051903]|uniref:SpoIIE family protein phosphatase n=1 Tax=Amycolatopsis sp. NPDC051903 TaxID=3363936 RepID=UPI0037B1ED04